VTAASPAPTPTRTWSWLRELVEADPLALVPRLSLLYLLLNPGIRWPHRVPLLIVAGVGMLSPRLARSPGLWLVLGVATGWRLLSSWPLSDNHDYLTSLWCFGLATCLVAPDPRRALARTARLLLGLTFAFATLWKLVLSPDFVDGSFFRVTLLNDARFANLAVVAGSMNDERFDANDAALEAHTRGVAWSESGFVEPPALRRLAWLLTLYTLLIETALAVTFLWPGSRGPGRWRDPTLLVFAATTFAVASVAGFGWLLMTLGLAQCSRARPRTRGLYLATFFLIMVYEWVPWDDALAAWIQVSWPRA
jgi:hypothetical protein